MIKNSVYVGEFKNNLRDGYGEEKYSDGTIYRGGFKDDLKEGKGDLILFGDMNNCYSGEFKEDKMCGKGVFMWNEKKKYIGEWEGNEISGYGLLIDDRIRHVGYFIHDVKDGYGCSFHEEQKFALLGKWENDLIEGYVIFIQIRNNNLNNGSSNNKNNLNEKIVKMNKGQIKNKSLGVDEINEFKSSQDYKVMIELYKNKFYPDYLRFLEEENK